MTNRHVGIRTLGSPCSPISHACVTEHYTDSQVDIDLPSLQTLKAWFLNEVAKLLSVTVLIKVGVQNYLSTVRRHYTDQISV